MKSMPFAASSSEEAFDAIDAGFRAAFVHLFGGGHGELRLLEEAGEADAGVEIIAQPPGKNFRMSCSCRAVRRR